MAVYAIPNIPNGTGIYKKLPKSGVVLVETTESFLNRGGNISVIPTGMSGIKHGSLSAFFRQYPQAMKGKSLVVSGS